MQPYIEGYGGPGFYHIHLKASFGLVQKWPSTYIIRSQVAALSLVDWEFFYATIWYKLFIFRREVSIFRVWLKEEKDTQQVSVLRVGLSPHLVLRMQPFWKGITVWLKTKDATCTWEHRSSSISRKCLIRVRKAWEAVVLAHIEVTSVAVRRGITPRSLQVEGRVYICHKKNYYLNSFIFILAYAPNHFHLLLIHSHLLLNSI